jgi:murein DD-endopeptidase MepM/ murein hydrolase activator NlpD
VLAAGDGEVSFVGEVARVPVVSIRHAGGLLTTYEPVRSRLRSGTLVSAGQRIGRLALVGSHCAPAACLHWGLRRGADYLDPLALLHLNPVRLLPLGVPAADGQRAGPALASAAVTTALAGLAVRRRRRPGPRLSRR